MHKNIKRYINVLLGTILCALSFDLFLSPLKIVVGGTNGLSILISEIFNIDISRLITIIYIIMIIVNILFYGLNETKKLLFCSIIYPLFVNLFKDLPIVLQIDYSNRLLHYLMSAVFYGVGCGLIFKNGFLGGGLDVLKKIVSDKLKIPMGKATFIVDAVIIISGGIIFGISSVMYAIIILYVSSNITDRIILGVSNKKMFYIMTKNPEDVSNCIKNKLQCGITEIDAVGGYTNEKYHILMTVISTRDYTKLKKYINVIDKNAFYIITDSYYTHCGK